MSRFQAVPKPSIIPVETDAPVIVRPEPPRDSEPRRRAEASSTPRATAHRMTFTGAIGAICMFPLRAIIDLCVALRVHPNVLTLIGVIINVGAAWALGFGRFILAGVVMIAANIFDFIDGKVAVRLHLQSRFGAFWDSTLDRFSD